MHILEVFQSIVLVLKGGQVELLHQLFDAVADYEVHEEGRCDVLLKLFCRERNQFQAFIHLGHDFEDDADDDSVHHDHTIAQLFALPDVLCEGASVVVYEYHS